ncbi:hypothetical protein CYMTET_29393 [Cymbomonas tetramitiformis]|uniref:Uncharacterized protein n=1 Tax=Cymbomonas tetramitiformis TaxID=36881 RepID=A0AAE0FKX5_9CHLO|nr:hypothetical protein CYMTET_29393 [Cymbomonas tetramitiformis]
MLSHFPPRGGIGYKAATVSSGDPVVTHAAAICPPTEEFSRVELQPVTRRLEACMAPTFFAGGCSSAPAGTSDVQGESDEDLFSDSTSVLSFVEHMGGLLCFGIAGVAAGFGGVGISNVDNSVTEDPVLQLFAATGVGWDSGHGDVPTCGVS